MVISSFIRALARRCSVRAWVLMLAVSLVAWLALAGPAGAVTHTWNGGGATDNWSDAFNWDFLSGPPGGGSFSTDVVFKGSKSTSELTVDYTVDDFTLDSSLTTAMTFTGQGLTLQNGSIVNYDGTTTLDQGILHIGGSSNLGDGGLIFDSGTLNTTGTFTNSRSLSINSGDFATLDVNTSTTLTHTGTITGTSADLFKEGAGTLVIAGAATYGNDTEINGGTLRMQGSGSLPITTNVSIGGAVWDLNDLDAEVASISGSGNIFVTGGGELSVSRDGGSTTYSGVISGDGSLDKAGSHALTLSGTNTYLGPTAIKDGKIRFSANANLGDAGGDLIFDGGMLELLDNAVDLGVGRSILFNAHFHQSDRWLGRHHAERWRWDLGIDAGQHVPRHHGDRCGHAVAER